MGELPLGEERGHQSDRSPVEVGGVHHSGSERSPQVGSHVHQSQHAREAEHGGRCAFVGEFGYVRGDEPV